MGLGLVCLGDGIWALGPFGSEGFGFKWAEGILFKGLVYWIDIGYENSGSRVGFNTYTYNIIKNTNNNTIYNTVIHS